MIERIEINLLPAEYRVRKRSLKLSRSVVYPAVMFLVLSAGAGFYTIHLNDTQARLTEEINAIEKEIQANKHIQSEINKLRQEKQVTDQKIRALERISVDREKWVRLLEILSESLPKPHNSWLISVKEDKGQEERLLVEARTYVFPDVANYMSKLEEADYIKSVELLSVDQIQGPQDRKVYKFNISCVINPEIGLGPALEEGAPNPDGAGNQTGRRSGRRAKANDDGGGGS